MVKNYSIDVHLLHMPNDNKQWLESCEKSLHDHPINIHHLKGIIGDIMQARINGFSVGSAKYVSFVDSDDEVLPHAFQHCLNYLENNSECDAVFTNSYKWIDDKVKPWFFHKKWTRHHMIKNPISVHQIVVIKRDIIEQVLSNLPKYPKVITQVYAEQIIYAHIANLTNFHFLYNVFGYKWRNHTNGSHLKKDSNLVKQYMKIKTEILNLPHHF